MIDTAHVYEDGDAERVVGQWLRDRPGVRERLVIVTKGAHPDGDRVRVTPEDIARRSADSIERLGGPVDLYLLHRDDPAVEVGGLVDALDGHRRAGEIRAFGVSNWTLPRIEEANAYAAARGVTGICCNSPHLSLAVQSEPPWPGCLSAADAEAREWHARTGMLLLAWSAQAGGYFAGVERRAARVYRSEANGERRARAEQLGARIGALRQRGRARVGARPAVPDGRGDRAAQRRAPAREPGGARGRAERRTTCAGSTSRSAPRARGACRGV